MRSLVLFLFLIQAGFTSGETLVRIATSANLYPYVYSCASSAGVCGAEVDIINSVCRVQGLNCAWIIEPWSSSGAGPSEPGGLLYRLTHPRPDGTFEFDAVVNSVSANAARRKQMLFSIPYYTANHIFIVDRASALAGELQVDGDGFVVDQEYRTLRGRKLRIGTVPGFLMNELKRIYATAKFVELKETLTGDRDLLAGQIDLYFAWNGIEKNIQDRLAPNREFGILSTAKTQELDPMNAVAVATRVDYSGRELSEAMSYGILEVRRQGIHKDIFMRHLGADLWACRSAPWLENDSKCGYQPK